MKKRKMRALIEKLEREKLSLRLPELTYGTLTIDLNRLDGGYPKAIDIPLDMTRDHHRFSLARAGFHAVADLVVSEDAKP